MIDTDKYESMRRLFLDFIDSAGDEVDEEAWKNKLTMLDELLAEVKRLLDYIAEYEEVTEPKHLDEIKRLEKRIEDMRKGAPRCSCPRISVNGNGGGGSIMVDVTFEDGEEYAGCLDRLYKDENGKVIE
tara:strand:+ start:55 stop:441 length:387 start_codon:yes stop_codon:yes gene_type:complete